MDRSISTPADDAAESRRDRLSAVRLGLVIAALGIVAALALVLVPGGTGPSDTLAVASLSSADLAVDSANGPDATLANDHADDDRYVSANPFMPVLTHDGGGDSASLGFGRLTSDQRGPDPSTSVSCSNWVIVVPGLRGGVTTIETEAQMCIITYDDGSTTWMLLFVIG